MSQVSPAQTSTIPSSGSVGRLRLRGHAAQTVPDAFPELDANGVSLSSPMPRMCHLLDPADVVKYCVVKSVISPDKAAEYADRMYKWGESFGLGFKADDRATWHVDSLPVFTRYVTSFKSQARTQKITRIGAGYSIAMVVGRSNGLGICGASRV